jgi:hypothetical protein
MYQSEKDVLGTDVVVVEEPRLFLGENDHPAGPVGEPFEHLDRASYLSPGPRRPMPHGVPAADTHYTKGLFFTL